MDLYNVLLSHISNCCCVYLDILYYSRSRKLTELTEFSQQLKQLFVLPIILSTNSSINAFHFLTIRDDPPNNLFALSSFVFCLLSKISRLLGPSNKFCIGNHFLSQIHFQIGELFHRRKFSRYKF